MKGRIFRYARYKAYNQGILTSCVNPANTSRECARCHAPLIRYAQGQPIEGYTPGAPLGFCPECTMRDHSDRNASIVIGQRLISRCQERFKEKPHTAEQRAGRVEQSTGVVLSQEAQSKKGPSISDARHGDDNGSGTTQGKRRRMESPPPSIPVQLRLPLE